MKFPWRTSIVVCGALLFAVILDYGLPAIYDVGFCSEQVRWGGKPCIELPRPIPYWPAAWQVKRQSRPITDSESVK
jgi:hypothetical protein